MNKKIIGFMLSVPVIASCIVSASAFASVDLTLNKTLTQGYYESMIAKRVLLGEDGAEQELQDYYASQEYTQQQKRELSQVAQAIDMFTDDVLGDYYQQWIDGMLDISDSGVSSDTVSQEYTQYTGFYQLNSDGIPRQVSVKSTDKSLTISAPDFNVKITDELTGVTELGAQLVYTKYKSYSSATWFTGFKCSVGSPSATSGRVYHYVVTTASGIFSGMTGRTSGTYVNVSPTSTTMRDFTQSIGISSSTTLTNYTRSDYTTFPSAVVGNWGSQVNLPSGNLTQKPWEYYNTTFLPWIKRVCTDVGFDYTKITPYPDGYYPPEPPTEPPTRPVIPAVTVPYNPFYEVATEVHTEVVEVTDESGNVTGTEIETFIEGVTDSEGEDDYKYNFKIPELPQIKIPDIQVPTDFSIGENLSESCSGIWGAIYSFLSRSGFIQVLVPVLTIGLLLFILRYLGG